MADPQRPRTEVGAQIADKRVYIATRYKKAISYYWAASRSNKRWYTWTRYLTVVLGALVTLLASLSSEKVLSGNWSTLVAVLVPIAGRDSHDHTPCVEAKAKKRSKGR